MTIRHKLILIQLATAAIVLVLASTVFVWSDLAQYRVVERAPVVAHYRGLRVVSAAPPSSRDRTRSWPMAPKRLPDEPR